MRGAISKIWPMLLLAGTIGITAGCGSREAAEAESASGSGTAAGSMSGIPSDTAGQPGMSEEETAGAVSDAYPETGSEEETGSSSGDAPGVLLPEEIPVEEQVKSREISLGFAGDICFGDNYTPMQYLASIGSTDISDGIDQEYLDLMRSMDLMWINNEFVYTESGEPLYGKMYTFWGSPDHVNYLHDMGVDIVGLANNHTFDTGIEGFRDTLETLENAGITYSGAGWNLEQAMEPVLMEAGGFTVAYVAASCAEYPNLIYTMEATETDPGILWCYDDAHILESIRRAREKADYVVVLPHWGDEHTTILQDKQINSARAYIDAGADIVIGAHPHILQGIDYYNGKPILYSLGNFWFDGYDIDTLVAEVRIRWTGSPADEVSAEDAGIEVILHPGTQTGVHTYFADTQEWRERIFGQLESISPNITIDDDGTVRESAG